MTRVLYRIVEHDGGWAYQFEGTFSETFRTHDLARQAAHIAAQEQAVAGRDVGITYEDKDGNWHEELSDGEDRPEVKVADE